MEVYIDNVHMPTPDKNGFSLTEQIEYSENAGSSASGLWSGDIKAMKKNVSLTWSNLTSEQALLIFNAVSSKIFFEFRATDPLNQSSDIQFTARKTQGQNYIAKVKIFNGFRLDPVTITVIER